MLVIIGIYRSSALPAGFQPYLVAVAARLARHETAGVIAQPRGLENIRGARISITMAADVVASSPCKVYGSLAMAQLIFSGYHIFCKLALDNHMPPALFGLMRLVISAPCVLLLAMLKDRHLPERRHHPTFFVLGLLGVGGSQGLNLLGMYYTNPINVGMVQPLQPIITAVVCIVLGIERLSMSKAFGILVSVLGCMAVVIAGQESPNRNIHTDFLLGNVLLIGNCLCMSAYLILQKGVLAEVPTWTVTAWVLVWGSLPMSVWLLCSVHRRRMGIASVMHALWSASSTTWAALLYGGIMAAGVAMLLTAYGVKHGGATTAASLVPLQPLFSSLLTMVVFREYPTAGQYAGALGIIGGLWMVLWASRADLAVASSPADQKLFTGGCPAGGSRGGVIEYGGCGAHTEPEEKMTLVTRTPSESQIVEVDGSGESTDDEGVLPGAGAGRHGARVLHIAESHEHE